MDGSEVDVSFVTLKGDDYRDRDRTSKSKIAVIEKNNVVL